MIAANDEIRFLGDVQRLELKPDDVLVLTVPTAISAEHAERLRSYADRVLPGRKIMVLGDGIKIGVIGPE